MSVVSAGAVFLPAARLGPILSSQCREQGSDLQKHMGNPSVLITWTWVEPV